MCRTCFVEFVRATGGADGAGADPPAFARALKKELAARQAEEARFELGLTLLLGHKCYPLLG